MNPATSSRTQPAGLQRLLYIADDDPRSDPAFHRALRLSELAGAELSVAVAVDRAPSPTEELLGLGPEELLEVVTKHHQARLESTLARYRDDGRQIEVRVLTGRPEVEISRDVVENRRDLVIKRAGPGTEKKHRPSGLDQKLVRGCPCPVWIEHGEEAADVRRILIPVDADPLEHGRRLLAHHVLSVGLMVAETLGAEVDILHAWSVYGEVELRGGFARTSKDKVDEYVRQHREQHERWLEGLVGELETDVTVHPRLVKGMAEHAIPAFAAETRPGLIVLGTVARTGVRGLVLGNTAESVLGQVQCGVMFVKPPGFTTPFSLAD